MIEALIFKIPSRLLRSAGNITTSKIRAFLELILQSISVKFCEPGINEYCRDSKQYLERLDKWKKSTTNMMYADNLYIVAADVKALYPSVPRPLIEKALKFVPKKSSQFKIAIIKNIIQLTMFCLDNVVIQHKEQFFKQANGIITGDNHSVSIANITMHYVIWPIAKYLEKPFYSNALLMTLFGYCMEMQIHISSDNHSKRHFRNTIWNLHLDQSTPRNRTHELNFWMWNMLFNQMPQEALLLEILSNPRP